MAMQPCAHCGLPAAVTGAGPYFCCPGCAEVYRFVHEVGLSSYYQRKSSDEIGLGEQRSQPGLNASFTHFDEACVHGLADDQPGIIELQLAGMHCAACVWLIERLPQLVPGVEAIRVDLGRGSARVTWDRERCRLSEIATTLAKLGYTPEIYHAGSHTHTVARRGELLRLAVVAACTGNVMLVSAALYLSEGQSLARSQELLFHATAFLFSLPIIGYGARPFFQRAWAGLRARQMHIDLPLSLGIGLGWLGSVASMLGLGGQIYFDSVCMLVALLLLGRWVQSRYTARMHAQADLLSALLPSTALRRVPSDHGADWIEVSSLRLNMGDEVKLEPGLRVPADGSLISGSLRLDTSLLTGESRPTKRAIGQAVAAGARVLSGAAHMRVVASGTSTRVGQLAEALATERSDTELSPLRARSDRWAARFVAVVLVSCLGATAIWLAIDAQRALDVAIALMVVSCPCALGLAPAVTLALARARAVRAGLLLPALSTIEGMAEINEVVFDKTGTLTCGHPELQLAASTMARPKLAAIVSGLEAEARHPLARALRNWAQGVAATTADFGSTIRELPGCGVEGHDGQSQYRLGHARWLKANGVQADDQSFDLCRPGSVFLARGDQVIAHFTAHDPLRPGAASVVHRLQKMGLHTRILSGDASSIVEDIAEQVGIYDWRAEQAPEDKSDEVDSIRTMMVGDGINDTQAMRQSRVGVAVAGGADLAHNIADLQLSSGIETLPDAISAARSSLCVLRWAMVFSLAYNAVFMVAAALGLLGPLAAAVLMPLSSLTVLGLAASRANFRLPARPTD